MDIYRKLKTLKKSQLLMIYNKLNSERKERKERKEINKKNTKNDIINLILKPLQMKRGMKYRMKHGMKRGMKRGMKHGMKRKSDHIKILGKYIIRGRKIVQIQLDTNYFKLLPDNVTEIYAYKSNSGILWHLALMETKGMFKKHVKSYTTGFVLNFEIQQYLENDQNKYKKISKTWIYNEIKSYTPKLLIAGIEKISQGGCNQDDFKFFEEPDNIKIKYYKVKDQDKWESQEYIPGKQEMKYDCPLIQVSAAEGGEEAKISYNPDYYMSNSVKRLIEEKYGNIPDILKQKSDPKKIIEFAETIYSEIRNKISELMEEHFEIVEQETDIEPIYNGTFKIESELTNYSVFRVKIKNKSSGNEYMLYFMLYYVINHREGSVDKYNLPIMILDIKNDNSRDFIYKNCVISTGLYTCKPYEYRTQTLQIFDSIWVLDHRDISGSRDYTLVSKYLSNMWPLNELKMIEELGHDLVDPRKKVVIPPKQNVEATSWLYY